MYHNAEEELPPNTPQSSIPMVAYMEIDGDVYFLMVLGSDLFSLPDDYYEKAFIPQRSPLGNVRKKVAMRVN